MLQMTSVVRVVDNSGAKYVFCVKCVGKRPHQLANINDLVKISVRVLRSKGLLRVQRHNMYLALILQTKCNLQRIAGHYLRFGTNCVILLDEHKDNMPIGTRIFGSVSKELRLKKYLKVISLASSVL